eukprot:2368479-Rhodomonas_salina.1
MMLAGPRMCVRRGRLSGLPAFRQPSLHLLIGLHVDPATCRREAQVALMPCALETLALAVQTLARNRAGLAEQRAVRVLPRVSDLVPALDFLHGKARQHANQHSLRAARSRLGSAPPLRAREVLELPLGRQAHARALHHLDRAHRRRGQGLAEALQRGQHARARSAQPRGEDRRARDDVHRNRLLVGQELELEAALSLCCSLRAGHTRPPLPLRPHQPDREIPRVDHRRSAARLALWLNHLLLLRWRRVLGVDQLGNRGLSCLRRDGGRRL